MQSKELRIVWVLPLLALMLLVVSSSFSTAGGGLALAAPIYPPTDNGANIIAKSVVKDKKIVNTIIKRAMRGVEEVSPAARRPNLSC